MELDYSLYLVTDSTPAILGNRRLTDAVEQAIKGGATVVQYRNKTADTAELIRTAKDLHRITRRYNIPLIINDRVDVAVAVGAEGVHIGQDDVDVVTARKLLGPNSQAIVGVSASTPDEALRAARDGATYLGLGTVFATSTKTDTKSLLGPAGVREILTVLSAEGYMLPCVCIGGINASNLQRVLFQSQTPNFRLSGVAVVSAIMASSDPAQASRDLKRLIENSPHFASGRPIKPLPTMEEVYAIVPGYVEQVIAQKPLCHNMINTVVQTLAANIAIAIGGSPIMSSNGSEAEDLARLDGSLVINMGTVTPESLANFLLAISAYNAAGNPVLLDPVGAGATSARRSAVKSLMAGGYYDVIKGNEGEIKTVAGTLGTAQQHGVDSGASTLTLEQKAEIVKDLAAQEQCVVLMTGQVDILSDGSRTACISNGHEYMGLVTGSGCTLGTAIAAFLAVHRDDTFMAALAAILLFEVAAETAAEGENVKGPGTFLPAWVDQLYQISRSSTKTSANPWIRRARVDFK